MGNNPSTLSSSEAQRKSQLLSMAMPSSLLTASHYTQCDAPPPAPPLPPDAASQANSKEQSLPPPPASPESDAIAQAAAYSSRYTNPGPYEVLSMDAKRLVALDCFEGFRCDVNKQMSPSMIVVHSFALSPSSGAASPNPMAPPPPPPSAYTFITQVGDDSGVFVSRVDTARGSVDARVQRMLLGGLAMFKLQMGLSQAGDSDSCLAEIDFGTNIPICTWTANLKYGSMGGGPVWGANYWQAITPNLAMGGEGMYIAAQGTPAAAYALKYNFQAPLTPQEAQEAASSSKNNTAALPPGMPPPEGPGASSFVANFHSNGMMTLNYKRVITPQRVSVGSELAFPLFAPLQEPPELVLGAEFNLTRSKLQWSLDCNSLKVQSLLETRLGMSPMSPRFTLAAAMDHWNQDFKFGYSIAIDG